MQGTWLHLQNSHRLFIIDCMYKVFMSEILDDLEQGNGGGNNNEIVMAILCVLVWAAAFGYMFSLLIQDGIIGYTGEISDILIV